MGFTKAALASSLLLLGQAAAIDPIVMKVSFPELCVNTRVFFCQVG
jgi:hypothetical protein